MKHISESIIGRKLSDIPLNKKTLSDGNVINIGYNPATDRESYFIFLSPEVWKKYSHDTFHKVGITGMIIEHLCENRLLRAMHSRNRRLHSLIGLRPF